MLEKAFPAPGIALPAIVRSMLASDAAAISRLLPDLGYEATPEQVQKRHAVLANQQEHGLFVADWRGNVIGWSHAYGVHLLESEGYAEIGGLVVLSEFQRRGIGSRLIRASEQWAVQQGFKRMRLRSGTHRQTAHAFYESLGYSKAKASFAFELLLP